MKSRILYLDNAASEKVDRRVADAMQKYFLDEYGNASSVHEIGENARKAVEASRKSIANYIDAKPEEIIFVSGGTEANNLALQGVALANSSKKKVIVSAIEHASVLEVCEFMKNKGYDIVKIPTDKYGIIDIAGLEKEIDSDTLLVSIMHVNNEIGVVQDIKKIGELCRRKGVYFHSDCVQSIGKEKIDVVKMGIDLLSASAHKTGGPKGIGFLYVKNGVKIKPIIYGGGQERGLRSGTENVPGIVGFAKALELASKINKNKVEAIRDKLINGLRKISGRINGSIENRIYNNVNVSFPGIDGETLVLFLSHKGIYTSTGSACSSRMSKESHVLKSLGLNEKEIKGSLRLTIGEDVNEKDIDYIIDEISKVVKRLKEIRV